MKLLYLPLLGLVSANIIRRDWTCPTLIAGCTKTYLVTSGTCTTVAQANNLSVEDFFKLNPSINNPSCNNMNSGCNYCVQKDIPVVCPTNYNSRCDKFYTVKSGDICWAILDQTAGLSLQNLYAWNPSIHNPSCDNLQPNCKYCVHVPDSVLPPEPHQPNIKTDCREYYQAVSGDYCYKIAQDKGVSLNDFMAWNPDVGPGCLSMLAGYWYCLRV